jgi:hypothetical protein
MLHLKLLEKQEQAKSKTSTREIIKIKAKINEIETKNCISFSEKINKIQKPLVI